MRNPRTAVIAVLSVLYVVALSYWNPAKAQTTSDAGALPIPHAKTIHLKHVLVIGETKGFEHDSVSDAMATIWKMGHDSGLL